VRGQSTRAYQNALAWECGLSRSRRKPGELAAKQWRDSVCCLTGGAGHENTDERRRYGISTNRLLRAGGHLEVPPDQTSGVSRGCLREGFFGRRERLALPFLGARTSQKAPSALGHLGGSPRSTSPNRFRRPSSSPRINNKARCITKRTYGLEVRQSLWKSVDRTLNRGRRKRSAASIEEIRQMAPRAWKVLF